MLDVPEPHVQPGTVLVRTAFSAISPGSERNASALAGATGAVRAVLERPDLARRAVRIARAEGLRSLADRARARLGEMRPLGSSSSGIVIAVGEGVTSGVAVGDRVACTGAGWAVHAEIACMPERLVVPVPATLALEDAAFGTLGAIALHAVRRAEPALGERVAVIGLGLIGQLCAQLLTASGARVAAFDLIAARADLARELGAEIALAGSADEQVAAGVRWAGGRGMDAVLVCAQSASDEPMVAAARMSRAGGRVVAVGLVPFGLPREIAYEKELDLRISRSTGAGRHDAQYEEHGDDYPFELARWTVARNVEAFLHAAASGRVRVAPLVQQRLPLARSAEALGPGASASVGILLEHPPGEAPAAATAATAGTAATAARAVAPPVLPAPARAGEKVGIAVVGAGLFARSTLIPLLARTGRVRLRRVVNARGASAMDAARAHGFEIAGTSLDEALADASVQAVIIATRHDAHARLAAQALRAGRHVFVEKPLAVDLAGLAELEDAARESGRVLMAGYNRRWSPHARAAREALAGRGPVTVSIRVAAPPLPRDHWLLDPVAGGGRWIGEGCHFVDLASYLCGDPGGARVLRQRMPGPGEYAAQVAFADGSVAQILCSEAGDASLPKERVEAHAGGVTVSIDDYRSASVLSDRRSRAVKGRGKGHAEEIAVFLDAVVSGVPPVPLDVVFALGRAHLTA